MVGDLEGLVGDGVALRLGRVVTVRPLFGVFPPDDHVQQQSVTGDLLVGLRLLGSQRRPTRPGRSATRNFSRSVTDNRAAVVIQASWHHRPVGVSIDLKPLYSAALATCVR